MKSEPVEKSRKSRRQKAMVRPDPRKWGEMNRQQRREMMRKMQSEDLRLEVVHTDAAGIASATRPITWQCRRAATHNRCDGFGCTTAELRAMADWLKRCRIRTVAKRQKS